MRNYTLEDITIGLNESFEVCITEDMMKAFLAVTQDKNPLHCDEAYAKANGYNSCVVYGMLTAGFYSTLAGCYLPGERCLLQSIDVKFVAPVFIGDELIISGTVKEIYKELGIIRVKAQIATKSGKKVSKAVFQAGIR